MPQMIETTWDDMEQLVTLLNQVIGMKGNCESIELTSGKAKVEATATEFKIEIAD